MLIVKLMLFSLENDIILFITSYTVYMYLLLHIKKSSINLILEWSVSVDGKFKARGYVCAVVLSRTDPWLWLAVGFSLAVSFFKTCRRVWELSRIWKRKKLKISNMCQFWQMVSVQTQISKLWQPWSNKYKPQNIQLRYHWTTLRK